MALQLLLGFAVLGSGLTPPLPLYAQPPTQLSPAVETSPAPAPATPAFEAAPVPATPAPTAEAAPPSSVEAPARSAPAVQLATAAPAPHTPRTVDELFAEVAKLNAALAELLANQRAVVANQRWHADKQQQLRAVSVLLPATFAGLGAGGLAPSVWYASKSDGSVTPAVISGLALLLGVALLIPRVRKRRAIRREIAAHDAQLQVVPVLSATRVGLTLHASF